MGSSAKPRRGVRGGVWYASRATFNNSLGYGVPGLVDPESGDEMVERFKV
jgi:hypothetical protein